jgi:hypothetical protein
MCLESLSLALAVLASDQWLAHGAIADAAHGCGQWNVLDMHPLGDSDVLLAGLGFCRLMRADGDWLGFDRCWFWLAFVGLGFETVCMRRGVSPQWVAICAVVNAVACCISFFLLDTHLCGSSGLHASECLLSVWYIAL